MVYLNLLVSLGELRHDTKSHENDADDFSAYRIHARNDFLVSCLGQLYTIATKQQKTLYRWFRAEHIFNMSSNRVESSRGVLLWGG